MRKIECFEDLGPGCLRSCAKGLRYAHDNLAPILILRYVSRGWAVGNSGER